MIPLSALRLFARHKVRILQVRRYDHGGLYDVRAVVGGHPVFYDERDKWACPCRGFDGDGCVHTNALEAVL